MLFNFKPIIIQEVADVNKHNGGLVRIREALEHTIKPSEIDAANYILKHPEEVIGLSVKELSEKSGSSQAAIIRLCKNIGISGYQELKVRIAGDLQTGELLNYDFQEITSTKNIAALIDSVSQNNIHSIAETLKILNYQQVELAIDAIHRANRIDIYGAAASQIIAQDAQQKFLRINKPCHVYEDAHLQLTSSVNLSEDDVAIGISYSGETNHILSAIRNASKADATTIGITGYGDNPLSEMVDINLSISSSESNRIRSAAMGSRISQLNIIDILYTGVASKSMETSVHYLNKTGEALQQEFRSKE